MPNDNKTTNYTVTCPICGVECGNILSHIKVHDHTIRTRKDIVAKFPEFANIPLQRIAQGGNYRCPHCDKVFSKANGLAIHIKKLHPDKWEGPNVPVHYNAGQTCAVCGKTAYDLKQHTLRSHNLEWAVYCETYNHDPKLTKIVSDETRKRSSINKTNFYRNTDRGKELRELQSQIWTESNPAQDPIIKQKIINSLHTSPARIKAEDTVHRFNNCRGIRCNYDGHWFRSYAEFLTYYVCKKNGIMLEYEPRDYNFGWYDADGVQHFYLPDFIYKPKAYVIEIKATNKEVRIAEKSLKYIGANTSITKYGFTFQLGTPETILFDLFGCPKMDHFELEEELYQLYRSGDLEFICKENSAIVKRITKQDNLESLRGVRIYGNNKAQSV